MQKKLKFTALICCGLFLFLGGVEGHCKVEGLKGLYTFNPQNVPAFLQQIDRSDLHPDIKTSLKEKVFSPTREKLVGHLETGKTTLRDKYIQLMHQITNEEKYTGEKPSLYKFEKDAEVLQAIQNFFNTEGQASSSSSSPSVMEKIHKRFLEESEKIQEEYHNYKKDFFRVLEEEGPYNLSKIFGFINHYLLGIMPSNFNEDTVGGPIPFLGEQALREAGFPILPEGENNAQRHLIFELLKNNGVLKTEIEDPVQYSYDPAQHMRNSLESNQVKKLRLGAGNFPKVLGDIEGKISSCEGFGEINCGGFGDFQDASITINVDSSQRPDIIASFLDLSFWASIPDNTLETVYDNTGWGIGLEKPAVLSEMYRVLQPRGFLKIQDSPSSADLQTRLEQIGFRVIGEEVNPEDGLFYLAAQKP